MKLFGGSQEPTLEQVHEQQGRRPSVAEVVEQQVRRKSVDNRVVTGASALTTRQSIVPVVLVTILFFMWGFAYGLLDVLNSRFQIALHITQGESSGLQASYFGAYFIGPLTYSGWFLRKFGYRYTFMLGLSIYCVGALMFWPSAVKRSFGGFCGAMFLAGSGLSTLETSANPYIAVCGPPKWSEFRLELSQSVQAVGSVVAPVLAGQVIFKNVGADGRSLESVQYVYLGIAAFVGILAVVFYFAPIPEISDADMADQAEMTTAATGYVDKPMKKQYTLFWGVAAQFSYVGAQVGVAAYFINYFTEARPDLNITEGHRQGANFYAIAQGLFAIGRFAAAGLMYYGGKPRYVLLAFQTLIMVFISAAIGTDTGHGKKPNWGGLSMLMITLFFESCIFPIIFALTLRGLGRHTKRGASYLVSSVCGGAVVPVILGNVADRIGTRKAMCIPLVFFFIAWSYPIYLNLVKGKELDAYSESHVGVQEGAVDFDSIVANKDLEASHYEKK
ncbi:L-fucose permease Glucose/galactose transporter-like protein [Cucurbitaria berberidis CBS 394.84]|uniref:L-fucose permease Glucose/galactose transporter-like protein n=1 Tax=Cucurbitaria berberidis CBS 394.84 TaxID=1168544 RepID=A0A9P4G794_9PLEO|nr:L-fucose permease Glucose/galactose transporter-like protein [Cucurbitaria berberidis CBS 394.84]KAF1840221.1 L-fucose permease Glucose/galactose transporter-like protein [Cucurbitaria berberidis CBS 394.84]